MFEFILAGFTGSLFSYLVAAECGILLSGAINESSRIHANKQSKLIKFKIEELREELMYMLNDVKHEIKDEIKTRAEYNSKNSENTSQNTKNNASYDTRQATIGQVEMDVFSEGSETYEGSEFFEKKSSNSGYSGERSSVSNESTQNEENFTINNDLLPKKSKLSEANLQTLENEVKMFLKSNYKYPYYALHSELSSVSRSNQSRENDQKIETSKNNKLNLQEFQLLNYMYGLNTNDTGVELVHIDAQQNIGEINESNNDNMKNNYVTDRMISELCLQQLNRNVEDRKMLDDDDRKILENLWKRSASATTRSQMNIKENPKLSVEFMEDESQTNQSGNSSIQKSNQSGNSSTQNSKQSGGSSTQNSKQSGGSSTQNSKQSGGSSTQNSKQSGNSSTQNSKQSGNSSTHKSEQNNGSSTPRDKNKEIEPFVNNADRLLFISNHTPTMDDESMKRIVGDFN
jgi:hypothetical protein